MRAPPSGSPAKIPDFRRTCRLKFEPRRRRRRPTPCNSTLPTCWGRQRSAATKIVRLLRSAAAAPGVPGLAAAGRHIKAQTRSPLSRLARNRQPRKALPAISMPEDPGPVLGKSRRPRHAPWAGAATCNLKRVDTIQQVALHKSGRVGASATTACLAVSVCGRKIPAQAPTKRSSPSRIADNRDNRSRAAKERVCRSRTSAQSDLGEGCSAISGRTRWQI